MEVASRVFVLGAKAGPAAFQEELLAAPGVGRGVGRGVGGHVGGFGCKVCVIGDTLARVMVMDGLECGWDRMVEVEVLCYMLCH